MNALLFRNAFVATADRVFAGDVLTSADGRIAAVGEGLDAGDAAVVDAAGKYLLPGGVDPHTHFDLDLGSVRASDDFYTGSVAAACGGTTTIIDHIAFGPPGCTLFHQLEKYRGLAGRCVVDYGFHGVLQHVDGAVLADMERLRAQEGVASLKLYLTYDFKLNDADTFRALRRARELDLTVCAHCENDGVVSLLRREMAEKGCTAPRWHPLSRPPLAEAEAVSRFLALAALAGDAKAYVVHLSTRRGLDAVLEARGKGQTNVLAETCPQYLFLDDSLYDDPREGLKYIMSPPLRAPADQAALWEGLRRGDIDALGTDHCPFFFKTQKQAGADDFTLCPGGAPGVELRMPLLFSEGFMKGRLSLPGIVRMCCARPAEIFGLAPRKGDIRPGADADLVLFDPKIEWTVDISKLHENVDYTPYQGMRLIGAPTATYSRGELVAENGNFKGEAGRGKYLRRS